MDGGECRVLRADVANSRLESLLLEISADSTTSNLAKVTEKITKAVLQINEFELLPKLLDSHLQSYVDTILASYSLLQKLNPLLCKHLAELIYVLTKVRGYKVVGNHFPNDVYDVPNLLEVLNSEMIDDFETYLNLLWLSTLVMVPFPLASIQAGLENDIAEVAVRFMTIRTNASKSQLMLLILLSNLVTRPDCSHLLSEYVEETSQDWVSMDQNAKLGHLMAFNHILKRYSNQTVLDLAPIIYSKMVHLDFTQLKHNPSYNVNSIHVLYLIKVSAKIARIAVLADDFATVASILNSYIHDVVDSLGDRFDAKFRESTAKNLCKIVSFLNTKAVNYASQLTWFVTDQLRIPELRCGSFVDDLAVSSKNLVVSRYHTVILFLGFLALTKSAPFEMVVTILSVFHSTCTISKSTFSFVQGSQLRDASCFAAWAVIRSLKMEDFSKLRGAYPNLWHTVFSDIMRIIIFDEDFTIRRCGIAVLQEFVGRFGSTYFKIIFPEKNNNETGALTLHLIELFQSSAVSSPRDAHLLILQVIELGFPKSLFYGSLFEEMINREVRFESRKLGGQYLSKLCALSPSCEWPGQSQYSTAEIVQSLISLCGKADMTSLYSLGEFLFAGLVNDQQYTSISEIIENVHFDHHRNKPFQAESLLHLYNAYLPGASTSPTNLEENILSITRLGPLEDLFIELQVMFDFFAASNALPIRPWELIRYIEHGNILLAQTSMKYIISQNVLSTTQAIVLNPMVNADTRAILVSSLGKAVKLTEETGISDEFSEMVLSLLDDYTLTTEGDVGLKVRGAALMVLENHPDFARHLGNEVEHRLIRLAGEPMDKLRVWSFRLLCEIKNIDTYKKNYQIYLSDYNQYFKDLVHFYNVHMSEDLTPAFWKGIVHTSGGLTGSNLLINISLRQVLVIANELNGPDVVVSQLLKLLRIPPQQKVADLDQRTRKTFNMALNLLGRIFDSGVELSPEFLFEALFIRTYNLQINTTDSTRIRLALKVFQHLSTSQHCNAEIRVKSRKRLCWITCFHPAEKVRASSSDCLFEICNELDLHNEILTSVENATWAMSKKSKADLQKLERAYLSM